MWAPCFEDFPKPKRKICIYFRHPGGRRRDYAYADTWSLEVRDGPVAKDHPNQRAQYPLSKEYALNYRGLNITS